MNPDTTVQTLVVHIDQLTPENMRQLADSGYTILRDPSLLIFARPLPQDNLVSLGGQQGAVVDGANGAEEAAPAPPTKLPNRRNNG